jgi:hypothetical protein
VPTATANGFQLGTPWGAPFAAAAVAETGAVRGVSWLAFAGGVAAGAVTFLAGAFFGERAFGARTFPLAGRGLFFGAFPFFTAGFTAGSGFRAPFARATVGPLGLGGVGGAGTGAAAFALPFRRRLGLFVEGTSPAAAGDRRAPESASSSSSEDARMAESTPAARSEASLAMVLCKLDIGGTPWSPLEARDPRGGEPNKRRMTATVNAEPRAEGGTRTLTPFRTADFESAASAIPPLRLALRSARRDGRALSHAWGSVRNPLPSRRGASPGGAGASPS